MEGREEKRKRDGGREMEEERWRKRRRTRRRSERKAEKEGERMWEMEEGTTRGRKSRKKNQLHTISTTCYANAQRLPFWMNTVTCSPHNILKVKEALDKEPTRKVLYLLPLFGQCVCW